MNIIDFSSTISRLCIFVAFAAVFSAQTSHACSSCFSCLAVVVSSFAASIPSAVYSQRSHIRYPKFCPFRIAPFACAPLETSNDDITTTTTSQTLKSAKIALKNGPTSGTYLNFAAKVANIKFTDIGAIGSLGDSVSAGLFVDDRSVGNIVLDPGSKQEFRSLSWATGANFGFPSIYNMFRQLNQPAPVFGGSFADTKRHAEQIGPALGLNMAVSSSAMMDIPRQIDRLVFTFNRLTSGNGHESSLNSSDINRNQLKNSSNQVMLGDDKWLMVYLFAGGYDICRYCDSHKKPQSKTAWEFFEDRLRASLERLRIHMQNKRRVLVNLVGYFDLLDIRDIVENDLKCLTVQKAARICRCLFDGDTANYKLYIEKLRLKINQIMKKIAWEYQARYLQQVIIQNSDKRTIKPTKTYEFLVYYQPALEDLNLSRFGSALVSPVDCFHPNRCGQSLLAYAQFNSLMLASEREKRSQINYIKSLVKPISGDKNKFAAKILDKLMFFNKRSSSMWYCPSKHSFIR